MRRGNIRVKVNVTMKAKTLAFCGAGLKVGGVGGSERGLESERRDDRPNYFGSHRPGQLFLVS